MAETNPMASERPSRRREGRRPGAEGTRLNRTARQIAMPDIVWAMVAQYQVNEGLTSMGEAVERLILAHGPAIVIKGALDDGQAR